MKTLKIRSARNYEIVEFDANDVPTVIRFDLTRAAARLQLHLLRTDNTENQTCFRYIMRRTRIVLPCLESGDHLWTGNIRETPASKGHKMRGTIAYNVTLTEREKDTADWLSDRGYLGRFFENATLLESPEDGRADYLYGLSEVGAWDFQESAEEDMHAFLTCNGSTGLAEKLHKLLDSIV